MSLPIGSVETLHTRHGAMLVMSMLVLLLGAIGASLASCNRGAAPAPVLRSTPIEAPPTPVRMLVPSTHVRGIVGEPDLRVRIRSRATSIEVRALGPIELAGARTSTTVGRSGSTTSFILSRSGRTWTVSRDRSRKRLELGPSLELRATDLVIDGAGHPGRVTVRARSEKTLFDVIEEIAIETYLSGVIAKEMVIGWDIEAFRVQAICARSYAMHEMLRARGKGRSYDVENTTLDQVYGGRTSDPVVLKAVASTRGVVLLDGYDLLRAYYSSTCGGRVSGGSDSWPDTKDFSFNAVGPLQAATRAFACQASPLFRWEVTRDRNQLGSRLRAYGASQGLMVRQLRSLRGIDVLARNDAGRPLRYRVRDNGGKSYQLSAEQLRIACNTGTRGVPKTTRATRVNSGDVDITITGSRVTIKGRGFGHGVGMCQFCAQGFASAGDDWRTMLGRFYPGARLVRAYE